MENNGQVPIIAERDRYRKQLTFDIDTKKDFRNLLS